VSHNEMSAKAPNSAVAVAKLNLLSSIYFPLALWRHPRAAVL